MAPKRLARIIGGLYLLHGALSMFAALMFESLLVPGDAAATADNVRNSIRLVFTGMLGAALANLFAAYRLLTGFGGAPNLPADQTETLAHSALIGFNTGFEFAIALFGVYVIGLGYLLYRSRYVPPVLAVLVVATGIGYLADSLAGLLVADYGGVASAVLVAPTFVGETAMAVWLLVQGVRTARTDRLAA